MKNPSLFVSVWESKRVARGSALLLALCVAAESDPGEAVVLSVSQIAKRTGLSPSTIQRARWRLENDGILIVTQRRGAENAYALSVGSL